LVSDGQTDAILIPIIDWTLREVAHVELCQGSHAAFWRLHAKAVPKTLADRMRKAVELFPCDVLFVHRDAEKEPANTRHHEIRLAFEEATKSGGRFPAVAVVPVRMLEAWLLLDERAIRKAAGNPGGKVPLDLPGLHQIEKRPNPKQDLREALSTASELKGRRLKKFNVDQAFWRVVDRIDDFSQLRELPAFQAFEQSVRHLKDANWAPGFYGLEG
jgi:hypothetical protein